MFLLFTIDYAWGIPFFPHNDTVNYRKPYFESKFLSLAMSILISKEFFFPTGISKCFEWNVLLFLGEISFPWYLTHVIFWQYRDWSIQVNHYDTRSFRFCLGIFAAWILHVFVEKPISKLTSHYCRYLSSENNNVKDSLLPVTQKAA